MTKPRKTAAKTDRWSEVESRARHAKTAAELDDIEQEIFGRKQGLLTLEMKKLGELKGEERSERGRMLNEKKILFVTLLEERRSAIKDAELRTIAEKDRLDVTLRLPERAYGHLHPIHEFIRTVEDVFGRMGFDVARGPEVESEEYNFNLLNIPAEHPARDSQDTFWIKQEAQSEDPNKRFVLRTHTSPVQIRYMQTHKPPFRFICPGKVYRKDADATHSPMFHQFEGVMLGKDVTLANMKAVMIAAIRELISPKAEFRFRTGFFPFVEPGLEVDMRWPGDDAQSREGKWLEIVGCGMIHPKVLQNCGIDPNEWQGFAFGFGVERMIMIRNQIPDLRSFYQNDLRFLRQF